MTEAPPAYGWPLTEGVDGGFVLDTFAARANPRAFTAALVAAIQRLPNVVRLEGVAVDKLDEGKVRAVLSSGDTLAFGHAIVAAGYQAFPMLERLLPACEKPLGMPVKGSRR